MSRFYITANGRKRKLDDRRCGTVAGYERHRREDQKPCDACVLAKRDYDAERLRQPENVIRNRASARAQNRSLAELARRHKAEYDALYAEHKARIFAELGIKPRP